MFEIKHGESRTKLYKVWAQMKRRCNVKIDEHYKDYGGRGITVCKEWEEYMPFRDWAVSNGYNDKLSLDRINNDGDYCPTNCRFVSYKTQERNRRTNLLIEANGQTKTLAEWAEITGIGSSTIRWRIVNGWNADDAVSIAPVMGRNYKWKGRTYGK